MATKEKSIQIIEFSHKESDLDGWFQSLSATAIKTGKGDHVGDKVSSQDEYGLAVSENSEQEKAIVTVGQMNELACQDITLSIAHNTKY